MDRDCFGNTLLLIFTSPNAVAIKVFGLSLNNY